MATVKVACNVPNGLKLNLPGQGGFLEVGGSGGVPYVDYAGNPVPGYFISEVDKDKWDEWKGLHADSPFILQGHVYEVGTQAWPPEKTSEEEEQPDDERSIEARIGVENDGGKNTEEVKNTKSGKENS